MSRFAKQFFYGSFFIVVAALLIGSIYFLFLKPEPSCFDNIQNQREERIDCGGPCKKDCALYSLQPIKLYERAQTFYLENDKSTLLLRVQNPNLDYGARSFGYRIELYASGGALLQAFEGKSFIYAGEIKYLIFPVIDFSPEVIHRVVFASRGEEWARAEDFKKPNVLTQNYETVVSDNALQVKGSVVNQDVIGLNKIEILALFHGKFGQANGASYTEIDNLEVGDSVPFSVIHPLIADVNLEDTKVFVFAYRP